MKNTLYVLRYAKRTSQTEAASNSDNYKLKRTSLADIKLHLSGESVTQSKENSVK